MTNVQIAQGNAEVGTISGVEGEVTINRASGELEVVQNGSPVFQGDTILTSDGGSVGITFIDDTFLALGENAELAIDEMVYDTNADSSMVLGMVTGVFSFISGEIAGLDSGININTPFGEIGIRGTAGVGTPSQVILLEEANNNVGEIYYKTNAGTVVLSEPYQMTSVTGPDAMPSEPVFLTLEEIIETYGHIIKKLPAGSLSEEFIEIQLQISEAELSYQAEILAKTILLDSEDLTPEQFLAKYGDINSLLPEGTLLSELSEVQLLALAAELLAQGVVPEKTIETAYGSNQESSLENSIDTAAGGNQGSDTGDTGGTGSDGSIDDQTLARIDNLDLTSAEIRSYKDPYDLDFFPAPDEIIEPEVISAFTSAPLDFAIEGDVVPQNTGLDDPGFELASLIDWDTIGSIDIVQSYDVDDDIIVDDVIIQTDLPATASEGDNFVVMTTGTSTYTPAIENFLGLSAGAIDTATGNSPFNGSAMMTEINISGDIDSFSFDYYFDSGDILPWNDFSILIVDGEIIELADVDQTGDYGDTGWTNTAVTNLDQGTHEIGIAVFNLGDDTHTSALYVDNLQIG